MEKDKKMLITLPEKLHKELKMESAKTYLSMNLIIKEALREYLKTN